MPLPAMIRTAAELVSFEGPDNIGGAERVLSLLVGGMLMATGVGRRDRAGGLQTLVGGFLAARGATGHCPIFHALDVTTANGGDVASLPVRRMVHLTKSVTVNRPPEGLYAYWRRLENLPALMEHLETVTELESGRSRWVAKGPLGATFEWEAEITLEVEGECLAWRSLPGSSIANSGMVRFEMAPGGRGTEVHVSVEYAPPAGALGDTLFKLLGEAPDQQLATELRRFKQLVEAGEVATSATSVHRGG
jgi:uncharacterized membrane protein